jgi:hypothetical protein
MTPARPLTEVITTPFRRRTWSALSEPVDPPAFSLSAISGTLELSFQSSLPVVQVRGKGCEVLVRKIRTIFAGQRVFVYLPRFIGVVVGEEFVTIERGRTIVLIAWIFPQPTLFWREVVLSCSTE